MGNIGEKSTPGFFVKENGRPCVSVDGASPNWANAFHIANASGHSGSSYLTDDLGQVIEGDIELRSPCDCPGCQCGDVEGCVFWFGFDDQPAESFPAGDSKDLLIEVNGVAVATVNHDFATSYDGSNKSTMYTPWISAIQGHTGLALTVDTEIAGSTSTGKPRWLASYSGPANRQIRLSIGSAGSAVDGDHFEFVVGDEGGLSVGHYANGETNPWASPVFEACDQGTTSIAEGEGSVPLF